MNSIDQELFVAVKENNLPEVERLLSVGADVNAQGDHGEMPLHWACSVQVCQALREHGADIEAKDIINGWTPLHIACFMGHLAVINELLSPNDSNGATNRGANIEAKGILGGTPLFNASWKGHLAVVKVLVAVGADVRAADNFGGLPIHNAVREEHSEVVRFLLAQSYATTCRLLSTSS
jgi:ankyrin repeat protein